MAYGKDQVSFTLPYDCKQPDWITYKLASAEAESEELIKRALQNPVQAKPLHEVAAGKKNALILISDGTRLVPSAQLLPPLLEELEQAGLHDNQIKILVAVGMHRHHTEDELKQLVGQEIYRRLTVLNHSALEEHCVPVGVTSLGTPVEVNRLVVEADLRIATGNIEPHRLVGMSGGVKALIPGCASQRTIECNHSLSQTYKAEPGYATNPVHEDLVEAQSKVPLDYLLNVVVNHDRELVAAVAGHPIAAHRQLAEVAQKLFLVPKPKEPYDLILVSAGGQPKDMQLYQAIKTLQNATAFTREGGAIVLAAECAEHYGSGIMAQWAETITDRQTILARLEQKFVLGAHKLEHLYQVLHRQRVWLYSSMPDPLLGLLGFERAEATFQETIGAAVQALRRNGIVSPRIGLMPYGAITFASEQS